MIRWECIEGRNVVRSGSSDIKEINTMSQEFAEQAKDQLRTSNARHILYAQKHFEDKELNLVTFFMKAVSDEELEQMKADNPLDVFYGVHNPRSMEDSTPQESPGLVVRIPAENVSVSNLNKILESKGQLIKKALGVDALPIEIEEDKVSFPWFSDIPDSDSAKAYARFISALCKISKGQSRINRVEKEVDNEKYAFRCFLLRLGFIGNEYKVERKILLKNFNGSSAYKRGAVHGRV